MGLVIKLLPYLVCPAVILISAALGVYLLFTSRETLIERYEELVYNLTHENPHDLDRSHTRNLVRSGRVLGICAILLSLGMTFLTYFVFFGSSTTV